MENRRFAWDDSDPGKRNGYGFYATGPFPLRVTAAVDEGSGLVKGFLPTTYELELIAPHYLSLCYEVEFEDRCFGAFDACKGIFAGSALKRLGAIAQVLGVERFEAVVAETHVRWQRVFDDIDERERQLPPCAKCGGARTYSEDVRIPVAEGETDRLCLACLVRAREQGTREEPEGVDDDDAPF